MSVENPASDTETVVSGELSTELSAESLIEEVSIDGMCGVY